MSDKVELPRRSKGKRPTFFDDPAVDHLMTMILELSTELSVVYTRLDTLERVLEEANLIDRAKLEAFEPGPRAEADRAEWRALFLDRLFRTIREAKGE
ncbi:MAG TPA: hypothetical protein VKZ79_08440 [Alphaproteobacteria bacterium]|nr:hypothetical protein [Alphaproteobacteria bacterium]